MMFNALLQMSEVSELKELKFPSNTKEGMDFDGRRGGPGNYSPPLPEAREIMKYECTLLKLSVSLYSNMFRNEREQRG